MQVEMISVSATQNVKNKTQSWRNMYHSFDVTRLKECSDGMIRLSSLAQYRYLVMGIVFVGDRFNSMKSLVSLLNDSPYWYVEFCQGQSRKKSSACRNIWPHTMQLILIGWNTNLLCILHINVSMPRNNLSKPVLQILHPRESTGS